MSEIQNIEVARSFLAALGNGSAAEPFTFQTIPDGEGDSSLAPQIVHSVLGDACWDRLMDAQDHGHGVFVMVNAGDGGGRRACNVLSARALFVDADGTPLDPLSMPLRPSAYVISGGGEHAYWFLRPGESLLAWSAAQRALAERLGTDPTVKDPPRVMRLPGTLHLKDRSNPKLVTLAWADGGRRYTISEVCKQMGATPSAPAGARGGLPSPSRALVSSPPLNRARAYVATMRAVEGEGGDLQTYKVAAKLLHGFPGLSAEDAWAILVGWNQTNASPPWTEPELRRKYEHARRYGASGPPVVDRPAPTVDAEALAAQNPLLDPSTYCYDLSRSGAPWRRYVEGVWGEGISQPALERLLENVGGMDKAQRRAWQAAVRVVAGAQPVYGSHERFAEVPAVGTVANTFRRPTLPPVPGDWSPVERVLRNLSGGDEAAYRWVLGWLAKLAQNVFEGRPARIGTAPVFVGAKGAGKGTLEEVCKALLGPWNVVSITQRELESSFNSYLDGVLLVFANEVSSGEHKGAGLSATLKDNLTCHERVINRKGVPQVTRTAVENWIFASNNRHRPVEVEAGDRRFTVIATGGAIDPALGAQVSDDARAGGPIAQAFLCHLLSMKPEELVADYRPLHTSAKDEVARASGSSATQFAREVRERGFWSVTGSWARQGLGQRDLYLPGPEGYRQLAGCPGPVVLRRTLMEVYRSFAQEVGRPAAAEATLLAALRDEVPGMAEAELLVDGRRERVLAGLPGALPEETTAKLAPEETPLPQQRTLNI